MARSWAGGRRQEVADPGPTFLPACCSRLALPCPSTSLPCPSHPACLPDQPPTPATILPPMQLLLLGGCCCHCVHPDRHPRHHRPGRQQREHSAAQRSTQHAQRGVPEVPDRDRGGGMAMRGRSWWLGTASIGLRRTALAGMLLFSSCWSAYILEQGSRSFPASHPMTPSPALPLLHPATVFAGE